MAEGLPDYLQGMIDRGVFEKDDSDTPRRDIFADPEDLDLEEEQEFPSSPKEILEGVSDIVGILTVRSGRLDFPVTVFYQGVDQEEARTQYVAVAARSEKPRFEDLNPESEDDWKRIALAASRRPDPRYDMVAQQAVEIVTRRNDKLVGLALGVNRREDGGFHLIAMKAVDRYSSLDPDGPLARLYGVEPVDSPDPKQGILFEGCLSYHEDGSRFFQYQGLHIPRSVSQDYLESYQERQKILAGEYLIGNPSLVDELLDPKASSIRTANLAATH